MAIPLREAADALRDVADTEQRSAALYEYQKWSPHLFLWA
jgi:hypothetical protein